MVQVFGALQPMWEIKIKFQALSFGLAQCWLLWPFKELTRRSKIDLNICVCMKMCALSFSFFLSVTWYLK